MTPRGDEPNAAFLAFAIDAIISVYALNDNSKMAEGRQIVHMIQLYALVSVVLSSLFVIAIPQVIAYTLFINIRGAPGERVAEDRASHRSVNRNLTSTAFVRRGNGSDYGHYCHLAPENAGAVGRPGALLLRSGMIRWSQYRCKSSSMARSAASRRIQRRPFFTFCGTIWP